ncbi:TetR/AcrR family transcriptional regulator [Amycolatopsis keratiniphila]|uniref:TetR/AcrR family transcriptional regulator n=1 Tax=Amycolatopsis keratiniphila TaxID=129921 RepID=UPI001B805CC7|nr:TetR/AcrR family transcriptional regulator [Amycolatopsis keratiniphila]
MLEVVADSGLPSVSLSTVAARAGVSQGRVQYYFPTKESLIEAAFDHANAASSARIAAKLGGSPGSASPRQALTVVLTELIPYDAQSLNHLRVRQSFAALALHHEAIAERMRKEYEQLHDDNIADLLRQDQRAGHLSVAQEPGSVARGLVALAEGLAYYVLIGACSAQTAKQNVLDALDRLYR